ncbi:hypothetical protein [Janthinobacterium lividum]|uniref:hypothetical protein n=1 Tax=Janthinobacterium lividum TaxID=29581 RepID=UPI0015951DF0|nr:hypothetical protein [Janthinobacterium lividum]QKY07776.1 hypothetical protein G8765_08300 [Janthinobacterium lividum]
MTSLFHLRLLSVFYLENVFTTCIHLTPQRKSSQPKKLSFLLKAAWQAGRRGACSPMKKRKNSSFELPLFFVKTFSDGGRISGAAETRERVIRRIAGGKRHVSEALLALMCRLTPCGLSRLTPTCTDLRLLVAIYGNLPLKRFSEH